jgi:hypothetical protein
MPMIGVAVAIGAGAVDPIILATEYILTENNEILTTESGEPIIEE